MLHPPPPLLAPLMRPPYGAVWSIAGCLLTRNRERARACCDIVSHAHVVGLPSLDGNNNNNNSGKDNDAAAPALAAFLRIAGSR